MRSFSIVCAFAICWICVQSLGAHVKMESMIRRDDFSRLKKSPADASHEVVIAIFQKNLDKLEKEVLERSTPGNFMHQKWMTFDEVGTLISNPEAVSSVTDWLDTHSVKVTWKSKRGEYIKATAPIHVWEKMLMTEFHEFVDSHKGKQEVYHLAEHYSVPEHIRPHIHAIFNTVQVPPIITTGHKTKRNDRDVFKTSLRVELQGTSVVTVSYLDSYYHIASNLGNKSLTQSVFETSNEYFSPDDLTEFQNDYDLTVQAAQDIGGFYTTAATGPCTLTGTDGQPDCFEGNLDVQYIMGVAQNVATIYWYVGGSNVFVTFVTDIADEANPPQVNSISWGSIEQANAGSVLNQFQTEAMKLAAIGVTVVVSSGDDGVVNTKCDACTSSTATGCACVQDSSSSALQTSWAGAAWSGTGYFPSFPASCPYVTAVGGTMGSGGDPPSTGDEIVCMSNDNGVITSGGGFSTHYPRPSWQNSAVSSYFANLPSADTPSAGYNSAGRGYPDISFAAVRYQVVIASSIQNLYGTSASAPLFAAMVSLVNSQRLLNNLTSVGFLNPTLYSANYTSLYNDVTTGDNKCCSYPDQDICCDAGFTASVGWDPTTGWGSLNFDDFASMFNTSAPYVVVVDDDTFSSTNEYTSAVAVIVIVLVVAGVVASGVWCSWYTCCRRQSPQSMQSPLLHHASHNGGTPVVAHAEVVANRYVA